MEPNIENLVKEKEQYLLNKYFGNLLKEAIDDSIQTIGDYPRDLPLKIEREFREYLEELWKEYSDEPLVLEEQKLRLAMTEDDREAIREAFNAASRITLLEKLTKSNHKDVTHYKALLHAYTKDLLMVMRLDFLEEITGRHINCKAFPD